MVLMLKVKMFKQMGMCWEDFLSDWFYEMMNCEIRLMLRNLGVKEEVKEKVGKVLDDMVCVLLVNRLEKVIRLLNDVVV